MRRVKKVVLYNGYSLGENPFCRGVIDAKGNPKPSNFGDWVHVCIGQNRDGRIWKAMNLAFQIRADILIWSTGASFLPDGTSEARHSFEVGVRNMWPHNKSQAHFIERISAFDEKSINTKTTMQETRKILIRDYGPSQEIMLYLVSSANHAPRVLRDATKVFADLPNITLCAVPAGTSYGGKSPADVVIYELGEPTK